VHHVACEQRGPLAAYKLPAGVALPGRALYTSIPLPGSAAAGMKAETPAPDPDVLLDSILDVDAYVRLDSMLDVRPGMLRYDLVLHGLVRSALLLHEASGKVRAASVDDSTDYLQCDGCTVPTYEEGVAVLYRPVNMFVLPGLPYPTLLLDTSTYEGRALSLVTFTPGGRLAEYRIYEYVVNC